MFSPAWYYFLPPSTVPPSIVSIIAIQASPLLASVRPLVPSQLFLGPGLDVSAYRFAPQSIVAPFSGSTLIWNRMLAPCTVGETVSWGGVVAMALVFVGLSCTLLFVSGVEPDYTPQYIVSVIFSLRTAVYIVVLAIFVGANLIAQRRLPKLDKRRGFSVACLAGTLAGNMWSRLCGGPVACVWGDLMLTSYSSFLRTLIFRGRICL